MTDFLFGTILCPFCNKHEINITEIIINAHTIIKKNERTKEWKNEWHFGWRRFFFFFGSLHLNTFSDWTGLVHIRNHGYIITSFYHWESYSKSILKKMCQKHLIREIYVFHRQSIHEINILIMATTKNKDSMSKLNANITWINQNKSQNCRWVARKNS